MRKTPDKLLILDPYATQPDVSQIVTAVADNKISTRMVIVDEDYMFMIQNNSFLSKYLWISDQLSSLDEAFSKCSKMADCGGITKHGLEYSLRQGRKFEITVECVNKDIFPKSLPKNKY